MKIIKIGIAPQEKIRERALAIARGDIKPISSDPKIWFTSVDSLSRVVRDENRVLWDVVCSTLPPST
jgi:predicted transcriptional regulator